MSTPTRPAAAACALLLLLALGAGCSGDDGSPEPAAGPSSPTPSAAPPARTKVSTGRVTGHLPRKTRLRVVAQAGDVVDHWFDAAYLAGDYPRRNFSDAFPGFTPGARAEAHGDLALMTSAAVAAKVDGVTATRRRVRVDVLAVRHRAVGLTARFLLDFRTSGSITRKVEVGGRLLLTHTAHGWRVFGYDVHQGSPGARRHRHDHAPRRAHRHARHPHHGSGHGSGRKGGGR